MMCFDRFRALLVYEAKTSTVQLVERVFISKDLDFEMIDIDGFGQKIEEADKLNALPLIIRSVDPKITDMVRVLCNKKTPFLFYIDDNFWEIKGDSTLAKYYQHHLILDGLKYIVGHASMVLCNSTALADYIRERYTKRVSVVPPMFDFSLTDGVLPYDGEEIRIGFAGSSSRKKDIQFLTDIIPEILNKHSGVVFEFAGVMPEGLAVSDRVRYFQPISNYAEYIKFQYSRGWKIGLAPLLGSESDGYKTNNKFREYSACYTVGIYSDSLSYKGSLIDDVNGLVCYSLTSDEWLSAISRLLDDTALRERLALAAHEFVKTHYDINIISTAWYKALLDASDVPPKPESKIVPLISFYKKFRWQLFLYNLRADDVYKKRGGVGLLKHILLFIYKKIVGAHGKS